MDTLSMDAKTGGEGKKEGENNSTTTKTGDKKGMLLNQPTSRTTLNTHNTRGQDGWGRHGFTDDQSHRLSAAESILARVLICALPSFGASPLSCPCPLDPCPGPLAPCPRAWDAKSVVLVAASCLYCV